MQTQIKEEISNQYNSLKEILSSFYSSYKEKNEWKYRVLDSFILYNFIILLIQLIYVVLVGTFPMNAFLSGVICCLGTIILAISLRMTIKNFPEFKQRVFAEYLVASVILYLVIINFLV